MHARVASNYSGVTIIEWWTETVEGSGPSVKVLDRYLLDRIKKTAGGKGGGGV